MSGLIDQTGTVYPQVSTDQWNYSPDSTAFIAASGFGAYDPILFQINQGDPTTGLLPPASAGVASWTVLDDSTGNVGRNERDWCSGKVTTAQQANADLSPLHLRRAEDRAGKGARLASASRESASFSKCRRVLLADNEAMLLDMLHDYIEPEFEVVGAVTNGQAVVEAVDRLKPDMVLLNIHMPIMNGLDAGREILRLHPQAKLLFVTGETDIATVAQAFAIGGSGFLLKQCRLIELLRAMRTIRDGGLYLTPLIAGGDLRAVQNQAHAGRLSPLSAREVEVLSLLVRGLPMKEAARRLGITARTVAFHKYNAMSVLGLRGNAGLVQFAVESGLLR